MAKAKVTKKDLKRQELYNILNTNGNLTKLDTCKKIIAKDKDIFTQVIMARTLDADKGVVVVCNTEFRSNDDVKNKAIIMKFIVDDAKKSIKMNYGQFMNEDFECVDNGHKIPVFGVCPEEDFAIMNLVIKELGKRKVFEGLEEAKDEVNPL